MKIGYYISILISFFFIACQSHQEAKSSLYTYPEIFPDYKDVTIPSSISPLNFSVKNAKEMRVDVKEQNGTVTSFYGKKYVAFPKRKWFDILEKNNNSFIELYTNLFLFISHRMR